MNKKMTPEELEQFIHRELRALPARKAPAGFEARLQAAVGARTSARGQAAEQLEQRIHRELRGLPLRAAPRTLEARVLAEIERRATVAWYHRSWSYWPAAVRAAFLVAGTAFAGMAITAFYRLSQGAAAETVVHEVATGFGWVTRFVAGIGWTFNFIQQMLGGLAFFGLMYALFVGLGAAAYRYLYRRS
ncbi:MAG: hypothetical protein WDM96_17215 [Lacunisphaera sp.]